MVRAALASHRCPDPLPAKALSAVHGVAASVTPGAEPRRRPTPRVPGWPPRSGVGRGRPARRGPVGRRSGRGAHGARADAGRGAGTSQAPRKSTLRPLAARWSRSSAPSRVCTPLDAAARPGAPFPRASPRSARMCVLTHADCAFTSRWLEPYATLTHDGRQNRGERPWNARHRPFEIRRTLTEHTRRRDTRTFADPH